jgi:transcriptional regulator of met regulon
VEYIKETAVEEGLQAFQVDDITWCVNMEGLSIAQKIRLKRILQNIRPWAANSVSEMRHC